MNALTCGIFLAISILGSVFGWKLFGKWQERVNAWKDNHKHREEWMECLLMGWTGLMLTVLFGISSVFLGFAFLACIL